MLRIKMRRLGAILIPLAAVAWGLFTLLVLVDLGSLPVAVQWLFVVVGLAATLAVSAAMWLRLRNGRARRNGVD